MKVGTNIPVNIYESAVDGKTSGLLFVDNAGYNMQTIDTFAGQVNSTLNTLANKQGIVYVAATYTNSGIYTFSINNTLTSNDIFSISCDTTNDVVDVRFFVNSTNNVLVKKVDSTGTLVSLDIGDIIANNESYYRYNGTYFILQNTNSLTLEGKKASYFAPQSNTYTKAEVDAKTTSFYRPMGSVQTYQDLPTTGNQIGDVYNIIEAYIVDGVVIVPAGGNVAYTANGDWDYLGGSVDLSNYYTKDETYSQTEIVSFLDDKAPINNPTFTGTVSGINKTMVGLGNVDNTSDANKNVNSANKLSTARKISLNGDVVGETTFDGSTDKAIPVVLSETGVTVGQYTKVNVDAKGRVISASNPITLSGYGITDATSKSESQAMVVLASNVVVSNWVEDLTYSDMPYRAMVTVSGMTENHIPIIIFSETEKVSGKYYRSPDSYNGGVYVYGKSNTEITILSIGGIKNV